MEERVQLGNCVGSSTDNLEAGTEVGKKEGHLLNRVHGSCLVEVFLAGREEGFSSLTVSVGRKCRGFGIPAWHTAAYP